jgi:hypothetical protein
MRVPELIAATCVSLGFRVPGRRSSKTAAFSLDVAFAAGVEILTSPCAIRAAIRLNTGHFQCPLSEKTKARPGDRETAY